MLHHDGILFLTLLNGSLQNRNEHLIGQVIESSGDHDLCDAVALSSVSRVDELIFVV